MKFNSFLFGFFIVSIQKHNWCLYVDFCTLRFYLISILAFSAAAAAKSLQLCPTLCDPMDCSLPGSSVHGIFQARILEWGAIAFSAGIFPWTAKTGEFEANSTCIFMRQLGQRRIQYRTEAKVHALDDWSQEGQRHHSILHLGGGFQSCRP